jgi:multimeric flavodoxin WrbA
MAKVLLINGSPRENGNTFTALSEVAKTLNEEGQTPGQVTQDEEGMQTMRTLGCNMAWMIRKLNVSVEGHPELESPLRTNFIR